MTDADGYKRLVVKPGTKEIVDDRKPDGVTYDHYIRTLLGVSTD